MEKEQSPQRMVLGKLDSHTLKRVRNWMLTHYTIHKNEFKINTHNVRPETTKIPEEYISSKLLYIGLGDFLKSDTKNKSNKSKNEQ